MSNEMLKQATEIIADGCGCHRECEQLAGSPCGCEKDAEKIIALVRAGSGAEPVAEPDAEIVAALEGIDDDYMTSGKHHPGYVLIPTAKFEALCAALAKAKGAGNE